MQQADICDPQSHFSTEVPRRALEEPVLLKALLALAARHDAILTNSSDCEASDFHGECLELLIVALNQPEETYDDNLLLTVVVLRFYEELERMTDGKCHLLGSNRLLNLMSRSASSGGLAEAVSWQFLRQAIYPSIAQHEPIQLDMRNYERSSVFHRDDDAARANVIIFYCACIIQLCCDAPGYAIDRKDWQYLADCVEEWHRNKPRSWQPLRYQPSNLSADRPFPELWIMSPPAGPLRLPSPWYDATLMNRFSSGWFAILPCFQHIPNSIRCAVANDDGLRNEPSPTRCRSLFWPPRCRVLSLISKIEEDCRPSSDGHWTVIIE